MTLHPDFTAIHQSIAAHDFKTEVDEKAKARARIIAELEAAAAEVEAKNPDTMEAALRAQARLLNRIFREYTRIAVRTTDIMSIQTYMRLALKAQAQYRVTVELLEKMKTTRTTSLSSTGGEGQGEGEGSARKENPPNEILACETSPSAPKSEISPNELLALLRAHGPFVFGRSSRPEKSPNEILRSALMSGVSPESSLAAANAPNEILPNTLAPAGGEGQGEGAKVKAIASGEQNPPNEISDACPSGAQ